MAQQSVTVHLPDELYTRVKRQAESAQRSVEEQLVQVVAAALPADNGALPDDLAAAVAQLSMLPDEALWRAARNRLPKRDAARLASLHQKRQREGLTDAEGREVADLTRRYERTMLVRAHAARLLKERGYDVSMLASAE